MRKATPATNTLAHAPAAGSKQDHSAAASQQPPAPPGPMSTQDLIARIWDTLNWTKSLQAAFIIAISGIALTLVLTGLILLTHALTGQTAAWPVSITITATVSYKAARRKRR